MTRNKGKQKVTSILAGEPQSRQPLVEQAEIDPSDFNTDISKFQQNGKPPEEDETEPATPEPAPEPEEEEEEADESEPEEADQDEEEKEPEQTEAQRKASEVKKEIVQSLMEPEFIIAFGDAILSRGGSMIPGATREDWKLDPEEKEIFAKILGLTVEEEGINFWPAKTWLIIAVIVVYGFKGVEFWDASVQKKKTGDQDSETPDEVKARALRAKGQADALEALMKEEKRKADLMNQIRLYTNQQQGKDTKPEPKQPPAPGGGDGKPNMNLFNQGDKTEEAEAEVVETSKPDTKTPETPVNNEPDQEPPGERPPGSPPNWWKVDSERWIMDKDGKHVLNKNGIWMRKKGPPKGYQQARGDNGQYLTKDEQKKA